VGEQARGALARRRSVATRKLQEAIAPGDYRPDLIRLDEVRRLIAELQAAEESPERWQGAADSVERGRLIREYRARLDDAPLGKLRRMVATARTRHATISEKLLRPGCVRTRRTGRHPMARRRPKLGNAGPPGSRNAIPRAQTAPRTHFGPWPRGAVISSTRSRPVARAAVRIICR
jgi:hypothetical protein